MCNCRNFDTKFVSVLKVLTEIQSYEHWRYAYFSMSLTNIGNFVNNLKLKEYVGDFDVYLFLLKICL